MAMFGLGQPAERFCATAQTRAAPVRKFFTAITSFTRSAQTRSGGDGPVLFGRRWDRWIRVAEQDPNQPLMAAVGTRQLIGFCCGHIYCS